MCCGSDSAGFMSLLLVSLISERTFLEMIAA